MFSDKFTARKIEWGTHILSTFGFKTSRFIEYKFAETNLPKIPARIGDIGSCGSLFALNLAKMGFKVNAIDFKEYHEVNDNLEITKTDVCNMPFGDNTFDFITCISTIEHIGLSAYGDPEHDDGDMVAIREICRVLKENGLLIITTPFGASYHLEKWKNSFERIYDYDRLMRMFKGLSIEKISYYIPISNKNWVSTDRNGVEKNHTSYQRSNLICLKLRKVTKE